MWKLTYEKLDVEIKGNEVLVGKAEGDLEGVVHLQKSKMRESMSKKSPVLEAYAQLVRFNGLSPSLGKTPCMIVPVGCWKISNQIDEITVCLCSFRWELQQL